MDWARDYAGLSDKDLETVFKYEEKSATVLRILASEEKPIIWSLNGLDEWKDWIQDECPTLGDRTPGLVLILAKRTGELSLPTVKKVDSDGWLERIKAEVPGRPTRTNTFVSIGEKSHSTGSHAGNVNLSGRRSVRTLPFSKDTFRLITRSFYIHSSIARVISRADVPVFSSSAIQMRKLDGCIHPAYVYNCRSSNAWDMDLALTATYFPHCGLTFAVLFGCSLSVEEEILRRLSLATSEAVHPLLMCGIFAELERSRHVNIVEATIDDMETRILELDNRSSNMEGMPDSEAESRNQEKRTAWLDTTYLRNSLISWNTQLAKLSQHVNELKETVFDLTRTASTISERPGIVVVSSRQLEAHKALSSDHRELPDTSSGSRVHYGEQEIENAAPNDSEDSAREKSDSAESQGAREQDEDPLAGPDSNSFKKKARWTGLKISDRIQEIIDEYDDKIRDCTMRVDGMAMATQWAHGETNVEIALATSRDSRHMRSIALVTMVFLPGTFFATVFSMTFFNWFGSDGPVVSKYLWIYVVVTALCTFLTIGCWWYFVSYRRSRSRQLKSAEEISLMSRAYHPH